MTAAVLLAGIVVAGLAAGREHMCLVHPIVGRLQPLVARSHRYQARASWVLQPLLVCSH